jgi:pilus assembly protein TadC
VTTVAAWFVGAAAASACWLALSRSGSMSGRGGERRLGGLASQLAAAQSVVAAGRPAPGRGRGPAVAAVAVGVVVGAIAAMSGGPLLGSALGSGAAFGLLRIVGRPAVRTRRWSVARDRVESPGRQLPAALDLLAACLSAGAAPEHALAAVGAAFEAEVGAVLSSVARLAALGAPVETAWSACLADRRWAPVARAVIRARWSGAALTDVLTHLADDRRRALRADAQAAAQRAGVRAVLPLGVCFLPAFVLVGVVPVVAGFAHALWS